MRTANLQNTLFTAGEKPPTHMQPLIPVSEAIRRMLTHTPRGPACSVPTGEADGRILQSPVRASRDAPPYDRVMMDGVALAYARWAAGHTRFRLQATVPAGAPPPALDSPECAIAVMTGGVCPPGADVVVPIEATKRDGEYVILTEAAADAPTSRFIHTTASDARRGDVCLPAGLRLSPPALAIAHSEGAVELTVNTPPRLHLITTGNEVVAPEQDPLPWQIRQSHAVALAALARAWGEVAWSTEHVPDEGAQIDAAVAGARGRCDILLLAGGVSLGAWDLVPAALDKQGVAARFHGVAQRPGKPLWFGHDGQWLVMALPGNPVSALCCARRYLWPMLNAWAGASPHTAPRLALTDPPRPHDRLTTFTPVCWREGRLVTVPTRNSGDLNALAATTGFVECPPGDSPLPSGVALPYYGWREH